MLDKSRVLGLLPARAGSKGIPGKNVRNLLGKPLVSWAAAALRGAALVSRSICSTNDEKVIEAVLKEGIEVPWIRPEVLSSDKALVVDVILHALEKLEKEEGSSYDYVALVQATSPTVTSADIDCAIEIAKKNDADTVITGFNAGQRHPSTMFRVKENGSVDWYIAKEEKMLRRQDLSEVFIRTGLVYVVKVSSLRLSGSIYGNNIFPLIIPEYRSITIDEEFDFCLAELIMGLSND